MSRIGSSLPALTLCFTFVSGCAVDGADVPLPEVRFATVDFGAGPVEIGFVDVDGDAVFEGDIVLGPTALVESGTLSFGAPTGDKGIAHAALSHRNSWPGGHIPFAIDPALPSTVVDRINQAVFDWNALTIVRLIPHASGVSEHFVTFTGRTRGMTSTEGNAAIGFQPGTVQRIRLGADVTVGTIRHEIGHTVGLYHEQSRTDRDSFIRINYDAIRDGREANFDSYVVTGLVGLDFGPYDIGSLMHYGSFTFAANSAVPTIVRAGCALTSTAPECMVNPSSTLTDLDRKGVTRQVSGDPFGKFRLRNDATGQCLRPENGSTTAGARVVLDSCTSTASRRWYEFTRAGETTPMIINEASRLCLDRDANSNLIQAHCVSSGNQRYRTVMDFNPFTPGELLQSGDRCLSRSTTRAQPFLTTTCTQSSNNRRWHKDVF